MKAIWKVMGIATLVAILGVASVASIAAQEPSGEWEPLAAGESHWYSFEYLGDGSQIDIRMEVDPDEGVGFSVWTPEQMQLLAAGEEVDPVGRGSVDPFTGCCLVWSGNFNTAGTYYILVEHTGNHAGTSYYRLEVAGDGVWFTEVTAEELGSQGDVAEESEADMPAAEGEASGRPEAGTGPDDASAPAAEWRPVDIGESHWYALQYAGDGSQILIQMETSPDESATFCVWTPEQIRLWGLGEEVEPIGCGSADPFAGGVLVWSGNFNAAGTYYVVVEYAGSYSGTSHYLLSISGDGVSN
jgi:hypothetical protein